MKKSKKYHSLVFSIYLDTTMFENLSEEEKVKREELPREYTGVYQLLSKGKRTEYDRQIGLQNFNKENKTKNSFKEDSKFSGAFPFQESKVSFRKQMNNYV